MNIHHSIIFLFVASLFLSCTNGSENQQDAADPIAETIDSSEVVELSTEQLKNIGIQIGKTEQREHASSINVNGTVMVPPDRRYTISFPMGGYLRDSRMMAGMHVKKGALLATMEDMQFIQLQEDYLVAKSNLVYTAADFNRQEALNSTKSASDKTFQQAKASYENQRILVSSLREKLQLIGIDPDQLTENNISSTVHILAPISGIVSKVNVNPGRYISPTDVLFELVDPSKVYVSLSVFEKDAQHLKPGQQVWCTTNVDGAPALQATIQFISPTIQENRTLEVQCVFTTSTAGLMPGSFVNAQIIQRKGTISTLPEEAVVRWQNKHYVFVAKSAQRFAMQAIDIGDTDNGYVPVHSTLPEQQELVIKNAHALLMVLKNSDE